MKKYSPLFACISNNMVWTEDEFRVLIAYFLSWRPLLQRFDAKIEKKVEKMWHFSLYIPDLLSKQLSRWKKYGGMDDSAVSQAPAPPAAPRDSPQGLTAFRGSGCRPIKNQKETDSEQFCSPVVFFRFFTSARNICNLAGLPSRPDGLSWIGLSPD